MPPSINGSEGIYIPFAAISAGTSIIGGILGASGASRAGRILSQKAQAVGQSVDQATLNAQQSGYAGITQANNAIANGTGLANTAINNAGTNVGGIYNTSMAGLSPYQSAGAAAVNRLQNTAGTFSFNPSDLQNTPGYQFQLQQGLKALGNQAAAQGLVRH